MLGYATAPAAAASAAQASSRAPGRAWASSAAEAAGESTAPTATVQSMARAAPSARAARWMNTLASAHAALAASARSTPVSTGRVYSIGRAAGRSEREVELRAVARGARPHRVASNVRVHGPVRLALAAQGLV